MKLYCNRCSKSLGEINKAELRKGMVCLCKECNIKAYNAECKVNEHVDLPPGDSWKYPGSHSTQADMPVLFW